MIARSLAQRPNLPPQQSSEHQVEIGGEIRLACASGSRMGTHHEQATPGKRGEPPAHQFPEPSLYPVANHRRANRTADNKAYLRTGVLGYRTAAGNSRCPERVAPPARRPERSVRLNSSGLLIRDCCGSTTPPAKPRRPAWSPRPLFRRRAARGPCGGARQGRRGRHGYASARGSRGPSPADGCSAGTYACSLELQVVSKASMPHEGRTCHASRGQALPDSAGGTADATWVSLLTVRVILAQVKLSRSRSTARQQHRDFHNASAAGDLGCGKSRSAGRHPVGWLPPRDGETALQRTYTPCGRTCGQRVAVWWSRSRIGRGSGNTARRGERIGE